MKTTNILQKPSSISSASILFGFSIVLYSWSLFILFPGGMCVTALLPFFLLMMWLVARQPEYRGWKIQVKALYSWIFRLSILGLIILAPIYSYYYGYYYTNLLFEDLGIEAREIDTHVNLFDRIGDIGYEREFSVTYEVIESLHIAEAKLRTFSKNRSGWIGGKPNRQSSTIYFGRCVRSKFFFGPLSGFSTPSTTIYLYESGNLGIVFIYEQSRDCINVR